MSLRFFHIFFITVSILMLLGGAWMAYVSYQQEPEPASLTTACGSLSAALFLAIYAYAFLRKTRKIIL